MASKESTEIICKNHGCQSWFDDEQRALLVDELPAEYIQEDV